MQNKLNFELKFFCEDFAPIRKLLKELGAKKVGTFNQKDYFFNLSDTKAKIQPRMKLRIQSGKKTLIYYKRPDFSSNKIAQADVVLFEVKDKKLLSFLKKSLGIKAIVRKKRELWKKENIVFNLDTLKNIGKIFEIELTSQGNQKREQLTFSNYRNRFLPYLSKIIRGSNIDLVKARS